MRCEWCGHHDPFRRQEESECRACGAIDGKSPGRGEGDWVLVIHSLRRDDLPDTGFEGLYLREMDPGRQGFSPQGLPMLVYIEATENLEEALRFQDAAAARREWMRSDGTIRMDGQPSRPLLAFNVEIKREPNERRTM